MDLHAGDYVLVKKLEELDDYDELTLDTKQKLSMYCGKICNIKRIYYNNLIEFDDLQECDIYLDDIAGKVVGNRIVKE